VCQWIIHLLAVIQQQAGRIAALEEAYVAGQKPVDAETVHEVLVPDLDGLEPRLTRLGYPVKSLCEALNARPAEIRAFLRGRLAPGLAMISRRLT
jgi:hypothetical protein